MAKPVSPEVLDTWRFEERFDCWNRAEFDLMLEPYADDAVFDISGVFADVAPVQGHEEMRRCWTELHETWEGIRIDPLEVLEAGERLYVVELRLWGKGARSGVAVDQRLAMLYTLREDGRVVRTQLFPDVAAATSAAESAATRVG